MTAVSLLQTVHSIDGRIRKATEDNDEFRFTADYNSGKPLGFGKLPKQYSISLSDPYARLAAEYDHCRWPP